MNWLRSLMLPPQGSEYAGQVDDLYMFITLLSVVFFVIVAGALAFFVWRYRRRSPDEITPHITHNLKLEIIWSVIPLFLVLILFFWGFHGFIQAHVAPAEAMEIQVVAKKWIWQFEYPNGSRTLNDIHVPIGKPVKLIMSSEDVIHSFFIPTMRVKMDVLPNKYTELWFTPTVEGVHQVLCTEYCGRGHSDMLAKIHVDSPAKYEDWLENGDEESRKMPLAELGKLLYANRGCATCHSLDGSRGQGPSFKGSWGQEHKMADGKVAKFDENYVRMSILQPQSMIVAGYEPVMPTFQGLLRDREITALIEFIKAQK